MINEFNGLKQEDLVRVRILRERGISEERLLREGISRYWEEGDEKKYKKWERGRKKWVSRQQEHYRKNFK